MTRSTDLTATEITQNIVRGAAELERTEHGLLPHRLPAWARRQCDDPQLLMAESQPSGVRLVFRTRATVVELDTLPTRRTYIGAPPRPTGVYDLIVDVREESHIFRQHLAIELSAENRQAVYVPPGVAHGFLTLTGDCEVHYAMSVPFEPSAARGVRWNDPAFGIVLPEEVRVISERDASWPDLLPGAGS